MLMPLLGHNINGTHHREEGVLEPNIALGPEENGLVLVVPEFDSNCTHLLPVSGQAMMPVEERFTDQTITRSCSLGQVKTSIILLQCL